VTDQAQKLRELTRRNADGGTVQSAGRTADATAASSSRRCTTLAVTSGKGGVGKTNLALMLSIGLSQMRKRVLLLDADLGLANVHILLGMAPKKSIADLVDDACSVGDVVCQGPAGIDVVPGASGLESMANIDPLRLELLKRRLAGLEQAYDYMVVDTGAGIGRTTTEFCASSDVTILVMTPEPTSLADAYAMVKILSERKARRVSVVVNLATSEREGTESFDRLNALVVRFMGHPLDLLGVMPSDGEIPRLIKRQKVCLLEQPRRESSVRIVTMARRLCGLPPGRKDSFFMRIFRTALDQNGPKRPV
jgi:flagellar biosynthesis protein FlhG